MSERNLITLSPQQIAELTSLNLLELSDASLAAQVLAYTPRSLSWTTLVVWTEFTRPWQLLATKHLPSLTYLVLSQDEWNVDFFASRTHHSDIITTRKLRTQQSRAFVGAAKNC